MLRVTLLLKAYIDLLKILYNQAAKNPQSKAAMHLAEIVTLRVSNPTFAQKLASQNILLVKQ